eukprot:scaffold66677_cov45-Phaeocystis_antarctica.AAC.2
MHAPVLLAKPAHSAFDAPVQSSEARLCSALPWPGLLCVCASSVKAQRKRQTARAVRTVCG